MSVLYPRNTHLQDQPRPSSVGDQNIAAAPQNKQGKIFVFRETDGRLYVFDGTSTRKISRTSADTQRSQRSKRDVLLNFH
jgi:hypothetical protein